MTLRSYLPSAPKSHIDLTFLKNLPDYDFIKPYYVSGVLPKNLEPSRTNIQYEMRRGISVTNIRGIENKLILATHGFQFMQIPENVVNLDVGGIQKQEYIENITTLVKEFLDAPFGLCYDCRVCKFFLIPRIFVEKCNSFVRAVLLKKSTSMASWGQSTGRILQQRLRILVKSSKLPNDLEFS